MDADRQPSLKHRLLASPAFWLGMIVVFAAVLTGVIELTRSLRGRRAAAANAPVPIPNSELERRRLVDSLDARLLEATPGDAPCPHEVWVPEPLGTDTVPSGNRLKDLDASAQLELALRQQVSRDLMDIVPAVRGAGGLERAIRIEPENLTWRRGVETYATLVIESLEDTRILGPVGAQTPIKMRMMQLDYEGTRQDVAAIPGRARARLVVWSYTEDRFVCASPSVEVETPPTQFMVHTFERDRDREWKRAEDQLLKARVETVIAAAIEARAELRAVSDR